MKKTYDDSLSGVVGKLVGIGGAVSNTVGAGLDVINYWMVAETINIMLNTILLIVVITAGLLAFTLLFLQKFWAFMSVIFIAIYAFHPKQEEKVVAAAGKIIAVAFKTVLLTVTMFLVIFSLSLFESLEFRLINDFFTTMQAANEMTEVGNNTVGFGTGWLEKTFTPYAFYGISHLVFIIIKLVLVVTIIFKLPGYFYELIDTKVEDMGDKMLDTIQQAQDKAVTKGM